MALNSGKYISSAKLYLRQIISIFKVIYRLLVIISDPLLVIILINFLLLLYLQHSIQLIYPLAPIMSLV
jgi:hypothetical protein